MLADKLNTKEVKHIQKPCHSPADLGTVMIFVVVKSHGKPTC